MVKSRGRIKGERKGRKKNFSALDPKDRQRKRRIQPAFCLKILLFWRILPPNFSSLPPSRCSILMNSPCFPLFPFANILRVLPPPFPRGKPKVKEKQQRATSSIKAEQVAKKVIFLSFFFSQIPEGNIKEESKGCLIFGDESESHLHNLLFFA